MDEQFDKLSKLLFKSKRLVILTGAGISTSSGLPDFRGDNGFWKANKPIDFQEFLSNSESRVNSWKRNVELNNKLREIKPNAGHFFVKKIIEEKPESILITQNIDGLHREKINKNNIIELHGSIFKAKCLQCHAEYDTLKYFDYFKAKTDCICTNCLEGFVKVSTISFGQALRSETLEKAENASIKAKFFIVLGSSLKVSPANNFVRIAKNNGAKIIILNKDPTPMDDYADIVINDCLENIYEQIK